ncbi:MAG: DNA mismatch repair endonuclease MutL [Bacteroidia bacterium]|nr:DNA mismatch repair endonuclease MutL [Bacteroidia bacterium]
MIDVIKLLPDNVANQIAAGEVVQRPASAVKEMLENCLDAKATKIKLFIKNGGSSLIKIQDNGIGMSETDARMCWERHATSKISQAQDLYSLNTYGFRGEALASIAAVSMVEMVTRRKDDDAGTKIIIHGSEIKTQELCAAPVGTSITVKNLFYNIPARRNFLKSIAVETKHIIEEFQRQAIVNPSIEYELYNNDNEVQKLRASDTEGRLKDILIGFKEGDLIQLEENTEIIQIGGLVGIPSKAKRTRGNQFFYANGRYIKSAYFHHAVMAAFEGLIDTGSFPTYCIFLNVDPAKIDVNIHPTKTDVKFEDEKHVYTILKSAVRKAIGSFVVQPDMSLGGLDGLDDLLSKPTYKNEIQLDKSAGVPASNKSYNPFESGYDSSKRHQDWAKVLGPIDVNAGNTKMESSSKKEELVPKEGIEAQFCFQLKNGYLVASINGELHVVNTHRSHKRILFEKYMEFIELGDGPSQTLLFPKSVELSKGLLSVFEESKDILKKIGFDLSHFGGNAILVNGLPPDIKNNSEQEVIENMLDDIANAKGNVTESYHEFVATSLANNASVNANVIMEKEVQLAFVNQLLKCKNANFSPEGLPTVVRINDEMLFDMFRKGNV